MPKINIFWRSLIMFKIKSILLTALLLISSIVHAELKPLGNISKQLCGNNDKVSTSLVKEVCWASSQTTDRYGKTVRQLDFVVVKFKDNKEEYYPVLKTLSLDPYNLNGKRVQVKELTVLRVGNDLKFPYMTAREFIINAQYVDGNKLFSLTGAVPTFYSNDALGSGEGFMVVNFVHVFQTE